MLYIKELFGARPEKLIEKLRVALSVLKPANTE